jgi:hypothetical protein
VTITKRPKNPIVRVGGGVRFQVTATGCPLPQYAWSFNGTFIPGATNAFFENTNVSLADAGRYEVVAYNQFNAVTNTALLTILTKPDIRITEVSSSQDPEAPAGTTADWFEISNFEDHNISLAGWRFNDSVGGLSDAGKFPDDLTNILAGESIILVETLDPGQFRAWWGPDNIPLGVRIFTYTGSGLSFKATGDSLTLWDDLATKDDDYVTSVNFGAADPDPGVTFIYNPDTEAFGTRSQVGVYGAFKALNRADVGSPGVITGPQFPQ